MGRCAALTIGASLMMPLIENMLKAGEAEDLHAAAAKRLQDAVERLSGAQANLNRNTRQGIADDLNRAESTRQLELRRRALLDVALREAQVEAKRADFAGSINTGSAGATTAATGASLDARGSERDIQKAIDLNAKRTTEAATAAIVARGKLISRDVAGAMDAATGATQRYEDAVDRLTRLHDKGKLSDAAYRDQLTRTTQARDDATKAAHAQGTTGASLADAQGRLQAATNGVQHAEAQLAVTRAQAQAELKAGTINQAQYTARIRDAQSAVNSATAAQKAATAAQRASGREATHGEQLGREAAAAEAQIRNAYGLAAAYKTSGEAALVAEAREKAESAAIKERGDVATSVDRQVRLAVAERVSEAEKSAASARQQADVQAEVNAAVTAGNVSAERAADMVRDRIADLPLLAAIEVAQQRGLKTETDKATQALKDQQDAQKATDAARIGAFFTQADASAEKQLAQLKAELSLVGATDAVRTHSLAVIKATQEATAQGATPGAYVDNYIAQQVEIAETQKALSLAQDAYNASLTETADHWDIIASKVNSAAQGMADAFGASGKALGDLAATYANYQAQRTRGEAEHKLAITQAGTNEKRLAQENSRFALQSSGAQIGAYGDMISAAKGFFKEGSAGYQALAAAEKVYRVAQLALSLQAMVQNALETAGVVTNAAAKATAEGTAGIASQSKLPFPFNIVAMAATGAALVAAGIAVFAGGGGGTASAPVSNTGTGTVLGDSAAKSESIKNAVDALKEVDTLTNVYSRQMSDSLRSIDSQIGNLAAVLVRSGDINASDSVKQGFKPNVVGSVLGAIPLVGGFLSSLFGTRTDVTASGLYGGAQSVGSILNGGFDAKSYSDVTKTSKFLGIVTGKKNSTTYGSIDPALSDQFTLILKSFNDAILAASGPLGAATGDIQNKLNSFVVNIGKIDLKGLTGEEIQDKLNAVFGAAADSMANAAFPGIQQFQKVGEGAFETLVRVSSTVEAVSTALDQMGGNAQKLSVAAKLGLADQFDSVSDFTSAVGSYFEAYYSKEEQAAAKTAQFTKVFDSLGLKMPATLDAFRSLVEAQDLTTAAGQSAYATLIQLAPAFADLQQSLAGAKSAADIVSERADLQRQLLELQGDTAALRALDLAKIDPSNRALQAQVWALSDAQDAAKNAQALADAWKSVGDTLLDEVKRIRGLTDSSTDGGFASLLGQFNAATASARGGDQDAAKSLPALSQSLLTSAAATATSRQELDRIRAQTAASLEATYGVISSLTKIASGAAASGSLDAAADAASSTAPTPANDDMASEIRTLRDEIAQMRTENNAGHAATASNTGRTARKLDDVTAASGGDAISVASAA